MARRRLPAHPPSPRGIDDSPYPSGPWLRIHGQTLIRSPVTSTPIWRRWTPATSRSSINAWQCTSLLSLRLSGSYEPTGDVLYLPAAGDDKDAAAQETPEGHAVRLDNEGRITHITAINAKWLLDRDGELAATLRDGYLACYRSSAMRF